MPVVHRAGSHAGAIEAYVRAWIAQHRGTPSLIAVFASQALGFRVTRHDVSRALHNLGVVSKTVSPTPGFSDPLMRAHYLNLINTRLVNCAQLVFIDEKKIKDGEFTHRFNETGYAPPGTRLATHLRPPPVRPQIPRCEVIGALGVVPAAPLLGGGPAAMGDIGLISFRIAEPKLEKADIIDFLTNSLPAQLNPFPGVRSVVVMDNMPSHREQEAVLRAAFMARGAILLFQPAQSPDLNPIEKAETRPPIAWPVKPLQGCTAHHTS